MSCEESVTAVPVLTTLVAAGSEQHLEVVLAVLPAFKLSTQFVHNRLDRTETMIIKV